MIRMLHRLASFMGFAAIAAATPASPVSGVRGRRDTSLPRPARKRSGHYGAMRIFHSYK